MVRFLSAALMLAAVSASASPEIPSFEFSAAQLQMSILTLRGAQIKAKAGSIEPQLRGMAWNLDQSGFAASRLRGELLDILGRVRRHHPPANGRPDGDPTLQWDLQHLSRELSQLARDAQWRLNDLRFLSSQAAKDEALVAPAARLLDSARRFRNETYSLSMDSRFAYIEIIRAGFGLEGLDIDRDSRDADGRAQDLKDEAGRLLEKVRPSMK